MALAQALFLVVLAIGGAFGMAGCASIWGFQDLEEGSDASVAVKDGAPPTAMDSTSPTGDAPSQMPHDATVRDVAYLGDTFTPPPPLDGSLPDTGVYFDGGCTECNGRCVLLQNDPNNCGACGRTCSTGDCQNGACVCPGSGTLCTPPGKAAACVDTMTDQANCGGCNQGCPPGASCVGGQCACPSPEILCGTTCVAAESDNSNCGKCGTKCPSGTTCQSGNCTCMQQNNLYCTQGCTNILYDPNNCNVCGNVCPTGVTCQPGPDGGICTCVNAMSMCPANNTTTCVNLQGDINNCGTCGHKCPSGGQCTSGSCSCPTKGTDVTVQCDPPNGACIDRLTDNANCGACGNVCPTGTTCSGGTCVCGGSLALCNGTCVNTSTDNANCGGCGNACPANSSCQGSHCVCSAGLNLCNGACVDETTNVGNCGGCGLACTGGNASWACVPSGTTGTGACAVTSCDPGYSDCDGNPANGCEAMLNSDSNNCGSCHRQCPLEASCSGGACACPGSTPTLCAMPSPGVCVNTNTDVGHCGSCSVQCGAMQQCVSGLCQCTATSCASGCCNGSTCELFSGQSGSSCGAGGATCGTCSVSGETCSSVSNGGTCACPGGLLACSGGCTDVTVDVNNCGGCGNICDSGLCSAGLCATPPPPDAGVDAGM